MPLIVVGIFSYLKSYETISEHALDSSALATEQLNRNIDILFQDTIKFLEIGKQESTVRFLLTKEETYEDAKAILRTFAFYRETYKFSESIIDINIVNIRGKAISEKKGVFQSKPDSLLENSSIVSLLEHPEKIEFIPRLNHHNEETTISVASAIMHHITHEVIGFIVIELDASVIESFMSNALIGESGFFYITDSTGNILISPHTIRNADIDQTYIKNVTLNNQRGNFINSTSPTDIFVVFNTSELTGWKIIGRAPLSEILKDAYEIRNLIFISAAFSIIFTITLYYFISARLIRPIRHLKEKMRQAASGNFEVKVWNESTDEIADLGVSFNIMLKKIKILIEKNIAEQEQLKKAELRTMQAQINPHFLYNTLDTIVWMAESKKSSQVIDITKALSHFFRITLSKGQDWITLKDELEHIRNYLIIQKIRYRDILDVEIDVDEQILQYKILKLTLQPIVENAIYHGIKNKRGKGIIQIKGGFINEGKIAIDIIDNGIGIDKQKLTEIQKHLSSTHAEVTRTHNDKNSFGMNNVHQRIHVYYGKPYGLTIQSEYGVGTEIRLTIPAER